MATIATTTANFAANLAAASTGDILLCANGSYGNFSPTATYPSVIIRAANALGATFGTVDLGCTGLTIDGFDILTQLVSDLADTCTVTNCRVAGYTQFAYSTDLTITDNTFNGTVEFTSNNATAMKDSTFQGNTVNQPGNGDCMRLAGNVINNTIRDNFLIDANETEGLGVHPDMLQFLAQGAYWPEDNLIRGNFIWDDPDTGWQGEPAQGITAGGENNIIEENLVVSGKDLAISVYNAFDGARPNIVRNNIVFPRRDGTGGKITIGSNATNTVVQNNVCVQIVNSGTGTSLSNNYQYSNLTNLAALYTYANEGSVWTDFVPLEGSAVDFGSGYGALTRLAELQGNPPPDPDPDPPTSAPLHLIGGKLILAGGLLVIG